MQQALRLEMQDLLSMSSGLEVRQRSPDAALGFVRPVARVTGISQQLRRIGAALDRVRAGCYGQCIQCGGLLEFIRLQQDPAQEACGQCTPG